MIHEFDDDAVCVHCGFDGAEFSHLRQQGHVSREDYPLCTRTHTAPKPMNVLDVQRSINANVALELIDFLRETRGRAVPQKRWVEGRVADIESAVYAGWYLSPNRVDIANVRRSVRGSRFVATLVSAVRAEFPDVTVRISSVCNPKLQVHIRDMYPDASELHRNDPQESPTYEIAP